MRISRKKHPNMKLGYIASTKAQHTLRDIQSLKYRIEKELNNRIVDNERFIRPLQKRVMDIIDQNEVIRSTIAIKEALLQAQQ